MNKFFTRILFFIFRMDNKHGFTIPELHRMKSMSPKDKKKFIREHKNHRGEF